jgi:hypothetical protein
VGACPPALTFTPALPLELARLQVDAAGFALGRIGKTRTQQWDAEWRGRGQ